MADEDALSRLIFRRKAELDLTWDEIGRRGGFSSHTVVYELAHKKRRKQTPRIKTLERLAKALEVPLDLVKVAAADAVALEVSPSLRAIAAAMADMSEANRERLVRIAEELASEGRGE